jgi:hypothetical protein
MMPKAESMAVVDQKERYRRQAALCYELAVTLSGEKASSIIRLGDAYAALAVAPDLSLPTVFAAQKYADPLCKKCGKRMDLRHHLAAPTSTPGMQAFRCKACGETLELAVKAPAVSPDGRRFEEHFVAASFRRIGDGFISGAAVECPDAPMAIQRAELMLGEDGIGGAIAFLRRVYVLNGAFDRAVILETFGEVPQGFERADRDTDGMAE